jgi:hypothetical protein
VPQNGVDRKTIYNDVRFFRAVEKLVAACGEALRFTILSCRIRGTRKGYLVELAKCDVAQQKRIVEQAMRDGRWPELPLTKEPSSVLVSFPLDKPETRAAELVHLLGRKAAARLGDALCNLARGNKPSPASE